MVFKPVWNTIKIKFEMYFKINFQKYSLNSKNIHPLLSLKIQLKQAVNTFKIFQGIQHSE